jgi:hypothetical protein
MFRVFIYLVVILQISNCSTQKENAQEKTILKNDFSSCTKDSDKLKVLAKDGNVYSLKVLAKDRLFGRIEEAKFCTEDEQCMASDLPQQFGGCTVGLNGSLSSGIFTDTRTYVKLFCTEKINNNCKPPTIAQCIKNRCISNGDL